MPHCPHCKRTVPASYLLKAERSKREVVCSVCGERLLVERGVFALLKTTVATLLIGWLWVVSNFNLLVLMLLVVWLASLPWTHYMFVKLKRKRTSKKSS